MEDEFSDLFNIDDTDLFSEDPLDLDFGNSPKAPQPILPTPVVRTSEPGTLSPSTANTSPSYLLDSPDQLSFTFTPTKDSTAPSFSPAINPSPCSPKKNFSEKMNTPKPSILPKPSPPKPLPSKPSPPIESPPKLVQKTVRFTSTKAEPKTKLTPSTPQKNREPPKKPITKPNIPSQPRRSETRVSPSSLLSSQIPDEVDGIKQSQNFLDDAVVVNIQRKREPLSQYSPEISTPAEPRRTLLSCTEIPSKKRRRIPGPAGAIEDVEITFTRDRKKQKTDEGNTVSLVGCSEDQNKEVKDSNFYHDFKKGPWLSMLYSADLPPFKGMI